MILDILSGVGDIANSPFIVPVAGCAMIVGIVAFTSIGATRKRQIESEERLAAIARGMTPPPTQEELALTRRQPTPDVVRRRDNIRRAGIIVTAGALGVMIFFIALWAILGQHEILSGVACGLVPLFIGIGLLIDANIQTRELKQASTTTELYPQP